MFQYAAGRALSLKRSESLLLDTSGFANYAFHQGFELHRVFNCTAGIARKADVREILGWQFPPGIRRVLSRPQMATLRRKTFVVEPHFHYWQGIENISTDCYITGYWQSEKYFSEITAQIRKDFSFRTLLENKNAELAHQIDQVNSISLHVRRGDYASIPKNATTYELCSLDYYKASIQYITERVKKPHFFVFSDDPVWVKSNLKIDLPHQYVDHNHGENSYNDMRLMSLCKHHIIANSSFSWWGAWLNSNLDKTVVAPKRWFSNQRKTIDLLPMSWITL